MRCVSIVQRGECEDDSTGWDSTGQDRRADRGGKSRRTVCVGRSGRKEEGEGEKGEDGEDGGRRKIFSKGIGGGADACAGGTSGAVQAQRDDRGRRKQRTAIWRRRRVIRKETGMQEYARKHAASHGGKRQEARRRRRSGQAAGGRRSRIIRPRDRSTMRCHEMAVSHSTAQCAMRRRQTADDGSTMDRRWQMADPMREITDGR